MHDATVDGILPRSLSLLLQNTYLPTMPEDFLMEAKRVLGGAFYGTYSLMLTLDSSFMNTVEVLNLYFRVSKRSPLLCGRGKKNILTITVNL